MMGKDYPDIAEAIKMVYKDDTVSDKQLVLSVLWDRFGFTHGVDEEDKTTLRDMYAKMAAYIAEEDISIDGEKCIAIFAIIRRLFMAGFCGIHARALFERFVQFTQPCPKASLEFTVKEFTDLYRFELCN